MGFLDDIAARMSGKKEIVEGVTVLSKNDDYQVIQYNGKVIDWGHIRFFKAYVESGIPEVGFTWDESQAFNYNIKTGDVIIVKSTVEGRREAFKYVSSHFKESDFITISSSKYRNPKEFYKDRDIAYYALTHLIDQITAITYSETMIVLPTNKRYLCSDNFEEMSVGGPIQLNGVNMLSFTILNDAALDIKWLDSIVLNNIITLAKDLS